MGDLGSFAVKGSAAWLVFFMLAVAMGGCVRGISSDGISLSRDSVELLFFVNETGQPLDGAVSLNGRFIGNASQGVLVAKKSGLGRGELVLSGYDAKSGSDFRFKFDFSSSDAAFDRIRFEVPLSDYEREIFNAAEIEAEDVEREIFRLANIERVKRGVEPLRWNQRIADVARAYSEALPVEGFHHTDSTGKGVKQRLSNAGIVFVVANENLFFSGSLTGDTDLAKAAISGWLESPGHRATLLDRDNLYSDAGVGVHCERRECYVVMNFAAVKSRQELTLKKGWVTFQYLHNPDYGFPVEDVNVRLELSASAPVNVHVVPDRSEYEKFVSGSRPDSIDTFEGVVSIDERFIARTGQGIIIESPEGESNIEFSLDFS